MQKINCESVKDFTNKNIIEEAQAKIIARSENPYYPKEQHLRDMELIEELTKLKIKYK